MRNLSLTDYKNILNFYKIKHHNFNKQKIKNTAETILAKKLCRCIKKIDKTTRNHSSSIAICSNSVFNKKKLKYYKFTCKKKQQLLSNKKTRKKLTAII